MRRNYAGAVKAFEIKHRDLFQPNGERKHSPNYGSSFAERFWAGYDHAYDDKWDKESRKTIGYTWYRAGQECRKAEESKQGGRND